MSAATQLLIDAFTRIREDVDNVLADLDTAALSQRIAPAANPIGWLVWHLLRVQDDHFAELAGTEQVVTSKGWHERFNLPLGASATGYGDSPHDVGEVRVEPELLRGYSHDVHEATLHFICGLDDSDLEHVVDKRWEPPVTMGVRIVSVIGDDLKHLGQAEYLKGLLTKERHE